MADSLAGRRAVVTGAGRGIGRAIAETYAREGASVVLVARTKAQLDDVAASVRVDGGVAHAVACDVGDADDVQRMAEASHRLLGGVDILLNNAGGSTERATPVAESDPKRWAECLRINAMGTYLCTHALLPGMIEQARGAIITMGSGMGHEPGPGNVSYRVAKAAQWMFTKSLAIEVWEHGIAVNEIVPGPVLTSATADRFVLGEAPPWMACERVKAPEEVAELALWLATRPPGGPTGQSFSLARRPPAG